MTNAPQPSVSVVVATYQRASRLAQTLGELLANVDGAEVVVVDDGSTDDSAAVLRRLTVEHAHLRPMSQQNAGGWLALLAGARVAAGEVVLLLDDDVVPAPGTVAGHAAHHAGTRSLVVVGYMPIPPAPPSSRSWPRDIYSWSYQRQCLAWEAHPDSVLENLWGGHLSMRRGDFLALAERIADAPRGYHRDRDLGLCAAESGLHGVFDRRLASRHLFERSPQGFAANASSSGQSLAEIRARHGGAPAVASPGTPLRALVARPRSAAAVRTVLWSAISALGALRQFRLQRLVAGRLWLVLAARGFEWRSSELQTATDPHTASGAASARANAPVAALRSTDQRPRVAVIIPCYNDGVLALEAVASIVEYEPVELVVVDDASTEIETKTALDLLRAHDVRVMAHETNSGLSAARRTGLAATAAPFVFPLDADDLLVAGALARLADRLEAEPVAAASYGDLEYFGTLSRRLEFPVGLDPYRVAYRNDYPMSCVFRRTALEEVGAWQDVGGMVGYEDWNLWMTLAERGATAVHAGRDLTVTRRRLHGPRMHGDSVRRHRLLYAELRRTHPRLFADIAEHRRRSPMSWPRRLAYPLLFGARPPLGLRTTLWALAARARRAARRDPR